MISGKKWVLIGAIVILGIILILSFSGILETPKFSYFPNSGGSCKIGEDSCSQGKGKPSICCAKGEECKTWNIGSLKDPNTKGLCCPAGYELYNMGGKAALRFCKKPCLSGESKCGLTCCPSDMPLCTDANGGKCAKDNTCDVANGDSVCPTTAQVPDADLTGTRGCCYAKDKETCVSAQIGIFTPIPFIGGEIMKPGQTIGVCSKTSCEAGQENCQGIRVDNGIGSISYHMENVLACCSPGECERNAISGEPRCVKRT
ncbi:MAG: hypothetical protein AABX11_03330 [Nanoarchaeota archaeon]